MAQSSFYKATRVRSAEATNEQVKTIRDEEAHRIRGERRDNQLQKQMDM
jgi:hypothetical protein